MAKTKKNQGKDFTNLLHAERPPWEQDEDDHPVFVSEGFDSGSHFSEHEVENPDMSRPITKNIVMEEPTMELSFGQKVAFFLSHILAFIAIALVSVWISDESMGGGGLSVKPGDAGRVFNWHPFMMICAFAFMTMASLAFRSPCGSKNRRRQKWTHGMVWVVTAVFAILGITAVVRSHNDPESGYIANLYSLHSWIGCAVLILYVIQFAVGLNFFAFRFICITSSFRAFMLSLHAFIGPFIYYATALTILLGIQEKEGFIKCHYVVEEADVFPVRHFFQIPRPCRIGHLLGLVVFTMALTTGYALYNFPKRRIDAKNI